MPITIQFADLNELAAELPAGHIVRVNALDTTEASFDGMADLRVAGIGVHVRAVNPDGHLLACYLPVHRMQVFGRRPRPNDHEAATYSQAWDKAEALRQRVSDWLAEQGFVVRRGVINLGDLRPMPGRWAADPGRAGEEEQNAAN
jgi:hypothetical protein